MRPPGRPAARTSTSGTPTPQSRSLSRSPSASESRRLIQQQLFPLRMERGRARRIQSPLGESMFTAEDVISVWVHHHGSTPHCAADYARAHRLGDSAEPAPA